MTTFARTQLLLSLAVSLIAASTTSAIAEPELTRSVEIATCIGPFMMIASNAGLSAAAKSGAQQRVDVLLDAFRKETAKEAIAQGLTNEHTAKVAQEKGTARNSAILRAASAMTDPKQRSDAITAHLDGCNSLAIKLQSER